jgi:hypothetical protein
VPEIAEERELRREGRADLDRAEVENAGAGATFEAATVAGALRPSSTSSPSWGALK